MYTQTYLNQQFVQHFQVVPSCIARSPGRINLIGEHTDYNEGFVFPAAIDRYIYVALSIREDNEIHIFSAAYNTYFKTTLHQQASESVPEWARYILGVLQLINGKKSITSGINLLLDGDIPLGAGLSSSAALTCATGFGINELFQLGLSRLEIAQIGQQTEHRYIGVNCGIMDQFASVMGKENQAFVLDCKDLSYRYFELQWPAYEILLINSNVKHNLASSAYNKRREACEQGVVWVKQKYPEVRSLRDINLQQLENIVRPQSEDIFRKCRFVVQENMRVQKASEAIQHKDIMRFGQLLYEAHWGLSKDYKVSCEELDFLVHFVQELPQVAGARMMGGGFGGCTINIIKKGSSAALIDKIATAYFDRFGKSLSPIHVQLSNGTSLLGS